MIGALEAFYPVAYFQDLGLNQANQQNVAGWFSTDLQVVTGKEPLGWLLAQGWTVTADQEVPGSEMVPPERQYFLQRNTMQNQTVLGELLTQYTNAYNTAMSNNDKRYEDILGAWSQLVTSVRQDLNDMGTAHNSYETALLGLLTQAYNSAAASITSALATASTAYNNAIAGIATFNAALNDLGTGYDDFESAVVTLINSQDAALAAHLAAITGIGTQLYSDYTTLAATARGLLTGLGTTELARINEEFAAGLAKQLQGLVSSGLYSSTVKTDIEARNTRDRDEQVQALNDRLAREQLENEYRLADVLRQARMANLGIRDKYFNAQQETYRFAAEMRNRLLLLLNSYVEHYLRGKGMYAELTMRAGGFGVDVKFKSITEEMQATQAVAQGYNQAEADQQHIMQFQISKISDLVVGLFGFTERRTDEGPDLASIGQIAAALGDAGATQIVQQ